MWSESIRISAGPQLISHLNLELHHHLIKALVCQVKNPNTCPPRAKRCNHLLLCVWGVDLSYQRSHTDLWEWPHSPYNALLKFSSHCLEGHKISCDKDLTNIVVDTLHLFAFKGAFHHVFQECIVCKCALICIWNVIGIESFTLMQRFSYCIL